MHRRSKNRPKSILIIGETPFIVTGRLFLLDNQCNICYISIIRYIFLRQTPRKEVAMTHLARRLEELFTEITFAEDRVFGPVQKALRKAEQRIDDTFTAITFAEAGAFDRALSTLNKDGKRPTHRKSGYRPKRFTKLCSGRA